MRDKKLYIFLLIAIFISGVAGIYVGSNYTKKKLNNYYLNLGLIAIAINLEAQVKSVEMLRKKEVLKGKEYIELLIDNNLASLSIYDKAPISERNALIISAIRKAKNYRKKYPGHQVSPALSESVQRALDLAE
ncbi:MAG: hypothetical protein AABZ10_16265 [Nitrospirota bacterium]